MREDPYPSRTSSTAFSIGRRDPIIYGDWTSGAGLTQEQVAAYEQNGFLVLKDVFEPREIDYLREEAARLRVSSQELDHETIISEPDKNSIRSIFKIHKQSNIFARLAADARLVRIAQFLLSDDVYIHQSRLNYKPGFDGKEFFWHSDFETWHVEDGMPNMRAVSMSVLLTENTVHNGPLMLIPGSHKHYIACVGQTPEDHYKKSLKKQEYGVPDEHYLTEIAAQGGIVSATGSSGHVVLFDCNTMHGSNSNITPSPRSNAFFVFNAVSNKLEAPFGPKTPRPEFIAARKEIEPIKPIEGTLISFSHHTVEQN